MNISAAPSFLDELTVSLRSSSPRRRISGELEWLVSTNGDSDPFDSVILFGFEAGRNDPSFVAKVPRLPQNRRSLEVEHRSLAELWALLGSAAEAWLPEPIAFVSLHGQPALVLSYIKGQSLVKASGAAFWAGDARVLRLFVEAARALRKLNEGAAVPLADNEAPFSDLGEKARRFGELFPLTAEEQTALERLVQVAASETSRAACKVLIQRDFWHGNLIRRSPGPGLVCVDWQFAQWSSDVSVDVYLFLMAAALTAAPHGPVPERARAAAGVLRRWRSRIIPAYLEAYGRPEKYALLSPWYGMLATCVEKATRPALDFSYSHPDDLMWRLLLAELVKWPEADWSWAGISRDD